ncbi:nitrite reductase/ring-hydroxylating ferredoxin subunit [Kitasatospora sp. SolWspMP-SS2h]|uniref:Rieske (2Fe-2S) protein n=1 Tax=Kitasatospora sp. SolWspMP-SS2h TaxID=1305729 RepID=UPI000DB96B41|nr:Rieske (2Fe-2S) protein [Kitasatospora sp. SolWspMP-SS2h]RAJ44206.1 nitrite reductase/ring-hydroxylating ferredoxin subunit [Kitasatospora sp. SolWspMP-SS2h]
MTEPTASRRTVLCCAAVALAGTAAAGCSSAKDDTGSASAGPVDLGPAADVPVGGGKVYKEQAVVVTQPAAGEYRAFSAKCTHAGCLVNGVVKEQIQCLCHGSRFGISDGAVQDGPAPAPLPAYRVAVQNGNLQVTKS